MIWSSTIPLSTAVNFSYSSDTNIWSEVNVTSYGCGTNVKPIWIQRSQFMCF